MTQRGRPSRYTDEIATEICARIAEGESLRQICNDERLPSVGAVCRWAAEDHEGFAERYARALESRAWLLASEIIEIADSSDDPQRSRLRVDARKWVLSKLVPRYSDRQTHEISGKNGQPIEHKDVTEISATERDQRLLAIIERARARGGEPPDSRGSSGDDLASTD